MTAGLNRRLEALEAAAGPVHAPGRRAAADAAFSRLCRGLMKDDGHWRVQVAMGLSDRLKAGISTDCDRRLLALVSDADAEVAGVNVTDYVHAMAKFLRAI